MPIQEALELCKEGVPTEADYNEDPTNPVKSITVKSYERFTTLDQVINYFETHKRALIIELPLFNKADKSSPFWKLEAGSAPRNSRAHSCNLIGYCSVGLVIRDTMKNSGYHLMPFDDFKYIKKIFSVELISIH